MNSLISKALMSNNPKSELEKLRNSDYFEKMIPELNSLVGLKQNKYHRWDVWNHTLNTVQNTECKLLNRWAALLHDIGKPDTMNVTPTGIHFYDHHVVGSIVAKMILKDGLFEFDESFIDSVSYIVRDHMKFKFGSLKDKNNVKDKTIIKFIESAGDNLEPLLDVMNADSISHGTEWDDPELVPYLRSRIEKVRELQNSVVNDCPVNGYDIMLTFDIDSGPIVGTYLDKAYKVWVENNNLSKDEIMNLIKE